MKKRHPYDLKCKCDRCKAVKKVNARVVCKDRTAFTIGPYKVKWGLPPE